MSSQDSALPAVLEVVVPIGDELMGSEYARQAIRRDLISLGRIDPDEPSVFHSILTAGPIQYRDVHTLDRVVRIWHERAQFVLYQLVGIKDGTCGSDQATLTEGQVFKLGQPAKLYEFSRTESALEKRGARDGSD